MKKDYERLEELSEIFKALANPQRLCIAKGLIDNECNVKKITKCMSLPQSTASQHISKLKAAGIISGERNGNEICYKVVDERIKKILDILL